MKCNSEKLTQSVYVNHDFILLDILKGSMSFMYAFEFLLKFVTMFQFTNCFSGRNA